MLAVCSPARAQQPLQTLHNHVRSEVSDHRVALVASLPSDQQMQLSIVLPLRNQAALTSLLARLYDPSSPDYRQFLSVDQFTAQFGPTADDYQAVVAFAQANGFTVTGTPVNRLIVPISGSVSQINSAFHLQMNTYQHPTESRTFFSPDREPSLNLSVPVAHIAGLDNFSLPHPMSMRAQNGQQPAIVSGSGPGGSYLGSDMRAAYYGGTTLDGNGQAVGLLEFGGYLLSDVTNAFTNAGQTYNVPINNVLLDGATSSPVGDDAEQALDIVQAIGMAPGLSQVRVYIGIGSDDANVLNSMASENLAKQLSSSWSWRPADPTTDDVFFQEMAAQGQSFFDASGDYGAFDVTIDPYVYPGEDQYVTAVGGTHLTTSGAAGTWVSETAWNSQGNGTGGGISPDNISIPSWQVGLATSANGGSATLRNVPDVAMEGDFDNYACNLGVCEGGYAGTSFAAPRWAGFMALINQQAVEAGTAPQGGLGFINPSLYLLAQNANTSGDLHDITSGNNDTEGQPIWFSAVQGYDLTTGWGSANGQSLINDLAGPQVPGFWIASSQSTVAVNPGSTGSTNISVSDAGGFTGNVTFAVTSTLPTGVTASFSPNPTTGATVLTLTASNAATNQSAMVTITGTSSNLTATTNLTVAVHTPSFLLSSSPNTLGLNQGASGTSTISVIPQYGFTGTVGLAISGLPAGVTAAFSPTSTTGTSTLTLTVNSSATPGTSTLTITGTSGSLTATSTLSLTIHGPSFSLFSGGFVNIGQGSNGNTFVEVEDLYGFTGNVNLVVSGLPTGVTASFSPNPTTEITTLTLTANSTATPGTSTITVTGTSGALTATTTVTLGVYVPTFTLSDYNSLSIGQGSSGTSYVYVNDQYGFTGSVNLSISGLPAGVTALWNPNPTTGTSALTLAASSSAPTGQYNLTIKGTSGTQTATTTLTLGVYAPTFTLYGGGSVTIGQGASATTYIDVTPEYGFTGSVNLAVTGLPTGVTASFSPNPTTGNSTITLTATSTAALGQYTLTIKGTSGTQTATMPLTLGVYAPTFTLSSYTSVTVGQGTTSTGSVFVTDLYGFTGSVNLAVTGLPSGVTASFSPNPTTGSSTMIVTASGTASLGQYTLTVTGTSGTQTATTNITLGVFTPTFTLSGGGSVTIGQGTSATSYMYIYPEYGFTGSVNFSVSGLPTGVTASFSPNPTTGTSNLILTASSTAALGQYNLTITGTSGTQTVTTPLTLGVYTPTFTLSSTGSTNIGQGSSGTSYVFANDEYGFTGAINLSVSGLPSGVTASFSPNPTTGTSFLTLTASSSASVGTSTLTITGTSGSQTVTTTLLLGIYAPGFTVSSSLGTASLNEGQSMTGTIYISDQYGFSGNVNLAASGLPSGVTASFSPNPTTGTSTLTLSASSMATPGAATVTITGTSGSITASTTFTLTINTPDYSLTAAPGEITLAPGGSDKSTLSVLSQYGFTGSVNLAITGLPSGVTGSFSANPATGSSILTLTASSTASLGTATAIITGTSGSLSASTTLPVTVRAAQTATSTTLTLTAAGVPASSVASGTMVTATASVSAGSTPLAIGQVNFCDATATYCDSIHLIGTAQLTSAGAAVLHFVPGTGSRSYKAVFAGTTANAASSSAASPLAVTASQASTTTIAQSGSAGNYTLTGTVTGQGPIAPSGSVSFLDTTSGNALLGKTTLGNNTATLTTTTSQSPAAGSYPVSAATGDFNGDGIPDLAVANSYSSSVTILLGKGDGTFQATATNLTTINSPSFVAVGDFNRDGHADLAVAMSYGNTVMIFLGNGDGTFTPANSTLQTGYNPASIAIGDFNRDGLQDLAVVNAGSSTVTILLGNGDGTFTAATLTPQTGSEPNAIAAADFNGDGILDLAVTNGYNLGVTNSPTITILIGNGDGTFTQGTSPAITSSLETIAVGDFNQDGKPDLAASDPSGSSIMILMGNGDGTFTAATNVSSGNYTTGIAIADFNEDGKPDLVFTNEYPSTVTTLLGNGDGTFTAAGTSSTGTTPIFVVTGDWNGDGIPDMATVDNASSTLTILKSQLAQKATTTATSISPIGQGPHAAEASYAGDVSYAPSASTTTTLTAQPGAPNVTVSPSATSITTTQPLTVTVTAGSAAGNPIPTGSITLTSGTYSSQQTLANGSATFTVSAGTLPVGSDTLVATYTPTGSIYLTANQSTTVTVTQAIGTAIPTVTATPTSLTITNLQTDTVSVSVSGTSGQPTPTGTITLTSGAYSTQQSLSSGKASFTIAAGTLTAASNTLTAAYSGDATYAVTSGTATVAVVPLVISVAAVSPITPGSSGTGNVTLTAGSNYSGTMTLTCTLSASPTGAQNLPGCTPTPATVTLTAGGNATATLSLTTTAATATLAPPPDSKRWGGGYGGSVLAIVLLLGLPSRRRRPTAILILLLSVVALAGLSGCGGSAGGGGGGTSGSSGTSAGTYTFTVTATDGTAKITASTNATITVQ